MKERPIIFKGEMVKAILDGRKTQTRRVVKNVEDLTVFFRDDKFGCPFKCPYGKPGDRLWVRETWADVNTSEGPAICYRADGDVQIIWRSSIYMPRWASRITLKILDIRVERLQDISEKDAIAEGIQPSDYAKPKAAFMRLWDSINAKKPGKSWKDNPWVWVIEFSRV